MIAEAAIEGKIVKMKFKDKKIAYLSLECCRKDNKKDYISAIVPYKMIHRYKPGDYLTVIGELRRQDSHKDRKIEVQKVKYIHSSNGTIPHTNIVHILGTIVTNPQIRIGNNKKIAMDFGVKTEYYFPCVAFNSCAKTFNWLQKGSYVNIWGRLNNRSFYSTKRKRQETIMEIAVTNMAVLDDIIDDIIKEGADKQDGK